MKKIIIHLFIWIAMAVGAGEEKPVYRTFTNTEGQTIQARIIRYDAARDQIQIELKDGKNKGWAALSVFSTSDQEYIQEWIAADLVLNEKSLFVYVDKKSENMASEVDYSIVGARVGSTVGAVDALERTEDSRTDREAIHYQVRLKNSGSDDIQNLKIEYCIYLANESGGRRLNTGSVKNGVIELGGLSKEHSKSTETEEVIASKHYERRYVSTYNSSTGKEESSSYLRKISEVEVEGIWIRIYGPEVEGVPVVRDVYYPKGFEKKGYQWNSKTKIIEKDENDIGGFVWKSL
ncbi:MAG: hypothetical protein JXR23_11155 [Pontiellaceae bacterium]|nr:hypothetical protein [Pontiellaceae bacterium]